MLVVMAMNELQSNDTCRLAYHNDIFASSIIVFYMCRGIVYHFEFKWRTFFSKKY